MRFLLTRTVALAGAAALAACEVNLNTEGLTSKETRTFAVSGTPDLTLGTFDGSIEVHSWDRNEVEVVVEKRAIEQALLDEMTIESEQQGDRIVLRVKGPSRSERRGITVGVHISPTARLLVALPRQSSVQAETADGAIRVENLSGRLVLRTGDGSVAAERVSGTLEVRTGDGAIRIAEAEGRLDLETEDGSISIRGRPAVVRAKTGDGSIRLQAEAETAMAEGWDLSTGDGSVVLTLPSVFHAEIDAETRDGSIRSSHPGLEIDRRGGDRDERRRELRLKMGEGGRRLTIRTGDGTIRFES